MFALIESGRARVRHGEWTSRSLSLAIHAALITAAVLATKQVAHAGPSRILEFEVRWRAPGHPVLGRAAPTPCGACRLPVLRVPVDVPRFLPDPGTAFPPTLSVPGDPGDTTGFTPGIPKGNSLLPGAVPLDARVVDEPPEMLSHPEPRYPELLRQAGIEGSVVVEAVIDTTGRAEAGSLRIVSASHPLFGAEAEHVVLAARYRPGRMDSRAVRVRVRVPIRFGIRP